MRCNRILSHGKCSSSSRHHKQEWKGISSERQRMHDSIGIVAEKHLNSSPRVEEKTCSTFNCFSFFAFNLFISQQINLSIYTLFVFGVFSTPRLIGIRSVVRTILWLRLSIKRDFTHKRKSGSYLLIGQSFPSTRTVHFPKTVYPPTHHRHQL